jgi:leader peptidase (prepilin peptidase)/N-methyltransferase
MTTDPLVLVSGCVFGLLLGSFMNVLIYRLPRNRSVIIGRSQCPHCNKLIRWFENVPLLSYIMLRGRCRGCHWRISPRYPIVEALSGLIAALVLYRYGLTLQAVWIYGFVSTMMVITFIDWSHRIIPDELSIGGTVFGWVGALLCLDITLVESLIGSAVGGGTILAVALLYKAIRKVDGMGGGDVKLMAMIGAFLGWQMIFPVLFIASFFGSLYGLALMRRGGTGKTAVAFGSFLAPAATLVFAVGRQLWYLYVGL